jgi:hypothetical protein
MAVSHTDLAIIALPNSEFDVGNQHKRLRKKSTSNCRSSLPIFNAFERLRPHSPRTPLLVDLSGWRTAGTPGQARVQHFD